MVALALYFPNAILFFLPGVPFGIIGAYIGKAWKKTSLATKIGGVLGVILGIILLGWLYV